MATSALDWLRFEHLIDKSIGSVEELKEMITSLVGKTVAVKIDEYDPRFNRELMTTQLQVVTPDMFYCFVPLSVVQEWYLTHQQLDRYIVYFEEIIATVYRVTVAVRRS